MERGRPRPPGIGFVTSVPSCKISTGGKGGKGGEVCLRWRGRRRSMEKSMSSLRLIKPTTENRQRTTSPPAHPALASLPLFPPVKNDRR